MTAPPDIERTTTPEGGHYTLRLPDISTPAVLDYTQPRPDHRIATHTFVPDAMRGQGVGQHLVQALVDDARAQGFRIEAQCSYVRALAARHPEWADVLA